MYGPVNNVMALIDLYGYNKKQKNISIFDEFSIMLFLIP